MEAVAIPLPIPLTTPPVTKMYFRFVTLSARTRYYTDWTVDSRRMNRLLALALVLLLGIGCAGSQSETVRERDKQRIETSKEMPGNDVPQDPADRGDRAPTDPNLEAGRR